MSVLLAHAGSVVHLCCQCRVVHEEFVRWFDTPTAGSPDRYMEVASEIWQLLQVSRQPEE
jgi:hypothetical protein